MKNHFNPETPDVPGIKYYSYGASLEPTLWSVFRPSYRVIKQLENAPNDGLVRYAIDVLSPGINRLLTALFSVPSSRWGDYKGTLVGVSHLDLINWTNRLKWLFWRLTGNTHSFNAVAFYLSIAGMSNRLVLRRIIPLLIAGCRHACEGGVMIGTPCVVFVRPSAF
jgi:triacylglycerol lipase